MALKERLAAYFDAKIKFIEEEWGMYNGYIGKVSDGAIKDQSKIRQKLVELNLNPDYFFYGQGSPQEKTVALPEQTGIPYYDLDVMAHISECLDLGDTSPSDVLRVPGFGGCAACFPVYGQSMEPRISSGDIIAVSSAITSVSQILWGEIYLVITKTWRTVKKVYPGTESCCIVLRAINPDYAGDTPIRQDELLALYQVRGVISRTCI